MTCYEPLEGWRQAGKTSLTFKANERIRPDLPPSDTVIFVPCGRCIGCRLDYACEWATRITQEMMFHDESYFLTFTFSDEFLPQDNSIRTWHLQEFWQRVRDQMRFEHSECYDVPAPSKFKYYAAGEYGENYGRVHYHAAVFSLPLPDKKYFKKSGDFSLYTSEWLSKLWPWGHVYVGNLTFESAAYVARYVTKKIKGDHAEDHYAALGIEPERSFISQGLGKKFYETYGLETYRHDNVVVRGGICRPVPRAYDRWLEKDNPEKLKEIKTNRELTIEDKIKIVDELHKGRHNVSMLVKEAQLSATRLDRGR